LVVAEWSDQQEKRMVDCWRITNRNSSGDTADSIDNMELLHRSSAKCTNKAIIAIEIIAFIQHQTGFPAHNVSIPWKDQSQRARKLP
jgi:hypothetical protein